MFKVQYLLNKCIYVLSMCCLVHQSNRFTSDTNAGGNNKTKRGVVQVSHTTSQELTLPFVCFFNLLSHLYGPFKEEKTTTVSTGSQTLVPFFFNPDKG